MRRLDWTSANAYTRARVLRRPAQDPGRDVMPVVAEILAAVAARGDAAVVEYARRFDAAAPTRLEVDREALALAVGRLAPPLVAAFDEAAARIECFHRACTDAPVAMDTAPGLRCGSRSGRSGPGTRTGSPPTPRGRPRR